jgi:hypothetical protein
VSAELREHIAAGAMHDSDERCDAPKCHPETRVAVQDELVNWIEHGDEEEHPKRIVWVTGPAGGGKTAIMGSAADACEEKGLLACGFFFSSFAGSTNRRFKRCLVATLAYQIVQHDVLRDVGERILSCVERNPAIFQRQLKVQFDQLLLQPLREGRKDTDWPKVIFIDGLDECQAEEYGDTPRSPQDAAHANEADQTEILHALLKAVNDPSFPFRIIIASRPEPAIQSFFIDIAHHTTRKIFLDDKYNPDADMLLFLNSKFKSIQRQYQLSASWPSDNVKQTLVENASGQFIYVAAAMRFIEGSSAPPQELLDQVMALRRQDVSANPFALLDALYTHILNSSPKPLLAARWLSLIFRTNYLENLDSDKKVSARFIQHFLESSPGEASYVLRGLNSLVFIPPTDDLTSPYSLFHKSLTDFLEDHSRCRSLYVDDLYELYHTRYLQIWKSTFVFFSLDCSAFHSSRCMIPDKGPAMPLSQLEREIFLHQFMEHFLPLMKWSPFFPDLEQTFDSYDVAWWVRSQDESFKHPNCLNPVQHDANVNHLFSRVHKMASRNIVFHQMPFTNSISSAVGIEDVALFAGTSERRCSRSLKNSAGRFQAGCTCCALDFVSWTRPLRLVSRSL